MNIYEAAPSKAAATARMYFLGDRDVMPLGPGSKEKKSSLEALGLYVGLDLSAVTTKTECGRRIADTVGAEWGPECYSTGDTVTLLGLNRLLDYAVNQALDNEPLMATELLEKLVALPPASPAGKAQEETSLTEETADTQQDIVEHLVELSKVSEAPQGVSAGQGELDVSDVNFEDGSWRGLLAAVQDWARLTLESSSPSDFDASLGTALGLSQEDAGDTALLFPRLEARLARAVSLRENFLDSLSDVSEGGATLETATQAWIQEWEGLDEEQDSESSGPIHAVASTWPIQQFVQHANDNELNLSPSYQRADVWPTPDSQLLIESVIRGIPLPSVILLQIEIGGLPSYEVVDGKQRLTSILRFTGNHPRAIEHVKRKGELWNVPELLQTFQTDYPKFKKIWKNKSAKSLTATVERELYFPFALRAGNVPSLSGNLEAVRGKYYSEIRDVVIRIVGEQRKLRHVFEQTSNYCIPVIVYKEATSDQVHEVFSLYNKQGKHLNAEEIRNALFHRLDLMRAILATAGDSENIDQVAPFLMDSMDELSSVRTNLETYGFGHAGYKRSKVLSWIASILFQDEGSPDSRSTAAQINSLFKAVKEKSKPPHPLRSEDKIVDAMRTLQEGLEAHTSIDDEVWAPRFKNSLGKGKWQELQLIPSLVALSVAWLVHGDDLEDVIDRNLETIQSRSKAWLRPEKTQTKEQWAFIARVVSEFLEVLEVDAEAADALVRDRFGVSGLKNLLAIAPIASTSGAV